MPLLCTILFNFIIVKQIVGIAHESHRVVLVSVKNSRYWVYLEVFLAT
jgi:hypothetical protein